MTDKIKAAFDNYAKMLCGRVITAVRYVDNKDDESSPWSSPLSDFDTLPFGIDLEISSLGVLGCTWGSEFIQYGLSFQNQPMEDDVSIRSVWDVSLGSRWKPLLYQSITSTQIYWQDCISRGVH